MKLTFKGERVKRLADHGVVTLPSSILGLATNRNQSAGGAAATVTLAAMDGHRHVVYGYSLSYDDTPPAGATITITRGAVVMEKQAVTGAGLGPVVFPIPLHGEVDEAMVGVLSAGGGAVIARLTLFSQPIPG